MRRGILLDRRWLQAPATRIFIVLLCLWQVVAPNWHVCHGGFAEGLPLAHCRAGVHAGVHVGAHAGAHARETVELCAYDELHPCQDGDCSTRDRASLETDERFQGLCLADYLQTFPSQVVLPFQLVFLSRTVRLPEFTAVAVRRFSFPVAPLSRGPPEL